MSNMSYCRFRNTANDLADCQEALEDLVNGDADAITNQDERNARVRLIRTAMEIAEMFGATVPSATNARADIEAFEGEPS